LAKKRNIKIREFIGPLSGFVGLVVVAKTGSLSLGLSVCFGIIAISLVILICLKILKDVRLKKAGILDIDKMSGFQFETYLGLLYKQLGYNCQVTRSVGDYGADLILIDKNGKKIVVQAKRYNINVGIKAVQEIIAAQNYYKAHESWIVTNSYFTQQAMNLAKANDVKLIDRDQLVALILKVHPNIAPKEVAATVNLEDHLCPKCGSNLVIKPKYKK